MEPDTTDGEQSERPIEVLEVIDNWARDEGCFGSVDEDYYQAFVELTAPQVEKLAIAVMLAQEKEVRRLAKEFPYMEATERIARFISSAISIIGFGFMRFDPLGRVSIVSRVGPEPTSEMHAALLRCSTEREPIIATAVWRTLPWLLSYDCEVQTNRIGENESK